MNESYYNDVARLLEEGLQAVRVHDDTHIKSGLDIKLIPAGTLLYMSSNKTTTRTIELLIQAHKELLEIHRILQCTAECPPVEPDDGKVLKDFKSYCITMNEIIDRTQNRKTADSVTNVLSEAAIKELEATITAQADEISCSRQQHILLVQKIFSLEKQVTVHSTYAAKLQEVLKVLPTTLIAEQPEWEQHYEHTSGVWQAYLARVCKEALGPWTQVDAVVEANIDSKVAKSCITCGVSGCDQNDTRKCASSGSHSLWEPKEDKKPTIYSGLRPLSEYAVKLSDYPPVTPTPSISDGSTASYYELPAGCSELQDLISFRDMNSQIGEIFRACYRYGIASHSSRIRDAKKIKFYAEAEIERLTKLQPAP